MMIADNARTRIDGSGYDAPGFAQLYDTARPSIPPVVVEHVQQMVGKWPLQLVVDLGCGTGLSTRPWASSAVRVVGIEPNAAMRRQAAAHPDTPANVQYRDGFSHQTGLSAASADVVTCSQSLHWMEPAPTFAEVARILRPGGIFAAYDYQLLPSVSGAVDQAVATFVDLTKTIRFAPQPDSSQTESRADQVKQRWTREGHLARLRDSGHFRFAQELWFHGREQGDAQRVVAYLRSVDGIHRLFKGNNPEAQSALAQLQAKLSELMGDATMTLHWSFQMWVGVR